MLPKCGTIRGPGSWCGPTVTGVLLAQFHAARPDARDSDHRGTAERRSTRTTTDTTTVATILVVRKTAVLIVQNTAVLI